MVRGDIEATFRQLVRHLYGEEIIAVPQKGMKPDWIEKVDSIPIGFFAPLNKITNTYNSKEKRQIATSILDEIINNVMKISIPSPWNMQNQMQDIVPYIEAIGETKQYRDAYINLVEKIASEEYFEEIFAGFAENYKSVINITDRENVFAANHVVAVREFLLHEIAIYTIVILWKQSEFAKIRKLLQITYFQTNISGNKAMAFRNFFYSNDSRVIDSVKSKMDNKDYISGIAQLWQERINEKYSVDQFSFADILIFNLDILFSDVENWYWFPRAYILSGHFGVNSIFWRFAYGLSSKNELKRYKDLFETDDVIAMKALMKKLADFKDSNNREYRYPTTFHSAPIITDQIKIEEIGSLN